MKGRADVSVASPPLDIVPVSAVSTLSSLLSASLCNVSRWPLCRWPLNVALVGSRVRLYVSLQRISVSVSSTSYLVEVVNHTMHRIEHGPIRIVFPAAVLS